MRRSWWLIVPAVAFCTPALAETVEAGWDTYFYDAPRYQAHVIDEVRRQEKVDVLSCEAEWCRVRFGEAEGYVRAFVVHGARNEVRTSGKASEAACFEATQPGGGNWQSERFCRSGR